MKRPLTYIILIGVVFIALPVFSERLHSDEVIYWEVARNISIGLGPVSETLSGPVFFWHMPLAFYIVSPFLKVSQHIFTARIIASLFTIGCAAFIYLISSKRYGKEAGFIGALFFLFSFQALRFGGRYYLDQFGAFFFLVSLYFLFERRHAWAGGFAVLAILAREYWAGVFPFLLLYIIQAERKARGPVLFAVPVLIAALSFVSMMSVQGLDLFLLKGAVANNLNASVFGYGAAELSSRLIRGWLELSILGAPAFLGAAIALFKERRHLIYILPQFVILSLIHGFVVDGGVTQYPLGLLAVLSVFSGEGLKKAFTAIFEERFFLKTGVAAVALQFISFNVMATAVSRHHNTSIYAFGYQDDKRVIEILRKEAVGAYIHGIWGAFVEDRKRWEWTDYRIQEAIEKDPDWFITYENYVDIKTEILNGTNLKIYRIGPYVMAHRKAGARMSDFISQKGFSKWALRENEAGVQPESRTP